MSSRVRQPRGGPEAAPASSQTTTQLPQYEPPQFTLNQNAQRDFLKLSRDQRLARLKERFQEAQAALSVAAGEINDRVTAKADQDRKRKERDGEDVALEGELEALAGKVEKMTARMDESMRKMIDGHYSAESLAVALERSADTARVNASTQVSTQAPRTQTQRERRRRERSHGAEEDESDTDEEEEQVQDFTPTDPAGGTQVVNPPLEDFRQRLEDAKTRYQTQSLTERYTGGSEYVNFKRTVHDAMYPNDEVPLPPQHEWFNDDGTVAAPGMTQRRQPAEGGEDSDDDIAVSRATISTKCPLTLRELSEPLTSTKCPHTFEAAAIKQFIGRRPTVQCPVSGCNEFLARTDLQIDAVLVRKIKRLQRAKELEAEEAEGEEGQRGHGVMLGSDDDNDAADVDDLVDIKASRNVKRELQSTATNGVVGATQQQQQQRPPPSSAVVDLGQSSDEEGG